LNVKCSQRNEPDQKKKLMVEFAEVKFEPVILKSRRDDFARERKNPAAGSKECVCTDRLSNPSGHARHVADEQRKTPGWLNRYAVQEMKTNQTIDRSSKLRIDFERKC